MAGLTNSLIINELPSDNPPDAKLKSLLLELFTQVAPVTNVRISRYGPNKSRRQGHVDFVYDSSVEFSMLALKNCKLFGKKLSMAPQGDMSASSLHRALVRGPASKNNSMNNSSMGDSVVCLDDEIMDISDSKSNSRRSTNGNSNSSFQGNSSVHESSSNEQRRGAKGNFEANGTPRHNSRPNTSNNSRNSSRNSNRNSSEKTQSNGRESGECEDSEHGEHEIENSDLSDGEVGGQVISHNPSPFIQKAVEKAQNSNNNSNTVPLFKRRQQSQSQPNLTTIGQSHSRPGHNWGQRHPVGSHQGPPTHPPNQPVSQRYGMPPQRPPMYRSTAPYANQTYQYNNNQQQQNYRGGYR